MLRQEAEARMIMGSGFPDEFASAICMRNAALTKNEKTIVLASFGNTLAFPMCNMSPTLRASDDRSFLAWIALAPTSSRPIRYHPHNVNSARKEPDQIPL